MALPEEIGEDRLLYADFLLQRHYSDSSGTSIETERTRTNEKIIGQSSLQIRRVVVDSDDTAVIIESIAPFIVHLGCVIKVITCIAHADKVP